MKKIILLLFCILFSIAILGCKNKKPVVTEQEEKDYYSCDDLRLYLTPTGQEHSYDFKLVSNDKEYIGYAYTNLTVYNEEVGYYNEKYLYFDNLNAYRCGGRYMLAEILENGSYFTSDFANCIYQNINKIITDANENKNVYVEYSFTGHEDPSDDFFLLNVVVFSFDKSLCENTYLNIITQIKEFIKKLKDEYPCYIDSNLPIITEQHLTIESTLKKNKLFVVLDDTNMTFTYQGILENN